MRERLEREIERLEGRLEPSATTEELANMRRGLGQPRAAGLALDDVRIGFQCNQRWEDMVGDERVRACRGCDRPVFNLSEMTRADAEAVLATRGLEPCLRFYRRADGTVMTSECSAGAPKRRLVVVASSLAATLAAAPAFAEPTADSGVITGKLTDASTREPLAGVTVIVTGDKLDGPQAVISDDRGVYSVVALPAGDYLVQFYDADVTAERSGVKVEAGRITAVSQSLGSNGGAEVIHLEHVYINQGLPPIERTFESVLGAAAAPDPAEQRPAVEWSLWARLGAGLSSQVSDVAARRVTPPSSDAGSTWEAALGADATFGAARHDHLRLGAWGEARTTTGPVGGAELVLEGLSPHPYASRIGGAGSLVLRAGGNTRVITAALGVGYVGAYPRHDPWVGWARHVVGARVTLSVNRAAEDPRDWSATLGLEVEPLGVLHAMFDVVTR